MKVIIYLTTLVALAWGGIITHEDHKGHGKATSFQNIKLDHFHPVAVYIKKEDLKYLEHPVEIGKTGASLKQEHGNKHEHGFAVQDVNHHINHHGHDEHGHEHQIQVHSGGYGGHQGHHYQEAPVIHEEPQPHHQRLNVPAHYQVHQQEDVQQDEEELKEQGQVQDHHGGHYQGGYQGGLGNYQLANVDGYALEGHASNEAGAVASGAGQRYTNVEAAGGHGKS